MNFSKMPFQVNSITKNIIPKIEEKSTDLIVIGMGGNDAFTLNSPKKWTKAIENLVNLLQVKFPETPIFFTNMPPIKEFPAFTKPIKFVIGNLVEILGKHLHIAVNNKPNMYYNNEIITLKEWSQRNTLPNNDPKLYFSDGVHPSELTYKVWGKETGIFIKSKLENRYK